MEQWYEDEQVWENLDKLIHEAWLPLKEFLDVMQEHDDELSLEVKANLFGGLGVFCLTYAQMRKDANNCIDAFNEAMLSVQNDSRQVKLRERAIHQVIDAKVENLNEGN